MNRTFDCIGLPSLLVGQSVCHTSSNGRPDLQRRIDIRIEVFAIFIAVEEVDHNMPIAGRTVQHRLKFTAAVASLVDMTPCITELRFDTMEGKFPIRTLPAFTPIAGRAVVFMSVASWTGSSLAKTMANCSFVMF